MSWETLQAFEIACTNVGVTPPEAVSRGIRLLDLAEDAVRPRPATLLDLSPDEILPTIIEYSVRQHDRLGRAGEQGLIPGHRQFRDQLAAEVHAHALAELDGIVAGLQPRFEELAEPIVLAATKFGFTIATTSDDVIEMGNEAASAAWREVRRAWGSLTPIVNLRIAMCRTFSLPPYSEKEAATGAPTNYSVCFAAGDNFSLGTGYLIEGRRSDHIDWLALAAGGIRLNTPTEVDKLLSGRSEWVERQHAGARYEPADAPQYRYPA